MITIGLFGGIGSGKSVVAGILKDEYAASHIEMDALGHQVMERGSECYFELIALLGVDILDDDGHIIRSKMAEKIFADEGLRLKVNAIIHPAVLELTRSLIEKNARDNVLITVVETALPNEARLEEYCDTIWYVTADREVRIERLITGRGYSREKTEAIIEAQDAEAGPDAANVIIDNSSDIETLKIQIREALRRG